MNLKNKTYDELCDMVDEIDKKYDVLFNRLVQSYERSAEIVRCIKEGGINFENENKILQKT